MGKALAVLLLLLALAAPAAARPLVMSPEPESLSVTIYRDPDRHASSAMDKDWLGGFALITETRTISLPAGESEIRFEGVAGGILPASAIVSGLPGGVGEKNRDARLLSPGALIDASLGRRVHIRRTNPVTGVVTESEAVIRSGPDGIVLQTPAGIEALRCTGLPETLFYDSVPEGLSDKPTLAVTTSSASAATVTVRLSYLASDFDWQANYIVQLAPDGRKFDLFAWLTLANENDESFPDARTQAVAGKLNRDDEDDGGKSPPLMTGIQLKCWPQGRTHEIPLISPPPPPMHGTIGYADEGGDIMVTGSRIRRENLVSTTPVTVISAEQEELGDLKLYRIPEPVTVAAHSQKQVALLRRTDVPFERLYAASVELNSDDEPEPVLKLMRTRNLSAKGLGLPLPSGGMAVFEQAGGRPTLIGDAWIDDIAIGQEVEIYIGDSADVQLVHRLVEGTEDDDDWTRRRYEIEISNATRRAVTVETMLMLYGEVRLEKVSRKLGVKNGRRMWMARVPANGRTILSYTVVPEPRPRPADDDDDDDGD